MKKFLSLLVLISLFSYLLAGTVSCPSFYYICCSGDTSESCKCIKNGEDIQCKLKITCTIPSKIPTLSQIGKNIKSTCN